MRLRGGWGSTAGGIHRAGAEAGCGAVACAEGDSYDTILILEESIRSAGPQGGNKQRGGVNDGLIIPHAIGGADVVADFHSGGGNYVMGDTHAKWFKAEQFARGGPNRKMFWLSPEKRALADQGKI